MICDPISCRHFVESRCHGTPLGQELDDQGIAREQVIASVTKALEKLYGEVLKGITRLGIIVTAN